MCIIIKMAVIHKREPYIEIKQDYQLIKFLEDMQESYIAYRVLISNLSNSTVIDHMNNLILIILKENHVISKIGQGTTKIVYGTNQTDKVFKFVILRAGDIKRYLSEPMYMLEKIYVNRSENIKLYINQDIVDNNCDQVELINTRFKKIAILTWYEDKAKYTDLSKFNREYREEGLLFKNHTKHLLETQGFTDLGDVNIGYFDNEPHFRWIDIQPSHGKYVDCFDLQSK